MDVLALLDDYPRILSILVVLTIVTYGLKQLAESSEYAAKLMGRLGARWRSQAEIAAAVETVRREKRTQDRDETNAVVEDLRNQLAHFKTRLEEVERHSRITDEYLTYDAAWHATNERHAAANGYEFPPPPHVSPDEFFRKAEGSSP